MRIVCCLVVFLLSSTGTLAQNRGVAGHAQSWDFKKVRVFASGVSEYQELDNDLDYAHSDAKNFLNVIKGALNLDSTRYRLLTNEQATAANIYSGLDWLLESSEPEDLSIIYFSGHGDVETRTLRQRGFLLAHDAPNAGYHAGGTVRVQDVQDYIETMAEGGGRVILIVDACRSGSLAGGADGRRSTAQGLMTQWKNTIKILSSQPGELSQEGERWGGGYGVFTYYLITGLSGEADNYPSDQALYLGELEIYLKSKIPAETEYSQNPSIVGDAKARLFMTNGQSPQLLASAGNVKSEGKNRGSGSLKKKDKGGEKVNISVYLNRFNNAVERKDWKDSRRSSAIAVYRQSLQEHPEELNILGYMKRELVAGLCNESQEAINMYMKGENRGYEQNVYQSAAGNLKLALDLMGEESIRYDDYFSRMLFLDAYGIYQEGKSSNWTVARHKLEQSLAIEPDAAYTHHAMGQVLVKFGNAEEQARGFDSFKTAKELAPMWSYPYLSLGEYFLHAEELDSALAYFDRCIEINPGMATAYNNRGIVYLRDSRLMESITDLEEARQLDPTFIDPVYNLATVHMLLGNLAEGITLLEQCLSIDEGYEPARNMLDNTLEGVIERYKAEGRFEEASRLAFRRMTLYPKDPERSVDAGLLYLASEQFEKAQTVFMNSIKLDQENGRYYYLMARAFSAQKDYPNAYKALEMGLRLGYRTGTLEEKEFEDFRDAVDVRKLLGMYRD